MLSTNDVKRAFNHWLSEVQIWLKQEGILDAEARFFAIAPVLFLKLVHERSLQTDGYCQGGLRQAPIDWPHFVSLAADEMLKTLNHILLPAWVRDYNPQTDFFTERSAIQTGALLKKWVQRLSPFRLLALDGDILGEAFEYFLHHDLLRKQALGVYFTPTHIVKCLLDLIELKAEDKIYDPTCGTGAFLIEAFKRLNAQANPDIHVHLSGREIGESVKIAKLNLLLRGVNPNAVCQIDTLSCPIDNQFDVVLANFPFSQKTDYSALYGLNGQDANPVFIRHVIRALKPQGRAAVIVPDRLLFHEHPQYIETRKRLLETCEVLGVIQLHEFVFMPYTKQPTSILIFKKGNPTQKVWFFQVREDGFKKTSSLLARHCVSVVNNDLTLLRALWSDKKDSPRSFSVPLEKIAQEQYHLSLNRYQHLSQPLHSCVPLGQLCTILVGQTPQRTQPHFYGGKHLFVRIGDLNQRIIKRTENTLTDQGVQHARLTPLKKETLLFSFRLSIAKVAFAGKKLYISEGIAGLIPKNSTVLSDYLYYVLPQLEYSRYLNRGAKGCELNKSVLKTLQIPLPSLEFQKQFIRALQLKEAKQQYHLKQVQKIMRARHQKIQALFQCQERFE